MKNINNDVYLSKVTQRINNGDFDSMLVVPFMTRNLFLSSIKNRLNEREENGRARVLTDNELKESIVDTQATAVEILQSYIANGFMEITDEGLAYTDLGLQAVKYSKQYESKVS